MGESELFSSYNNPVFIVMMRNSRAKLFVYVAVLCVLCFIVFLLSSTHTSLKELEGVNEKCQQQRDSLSAQLQVVYEHKSRLEKSLQQEKTDHKHTKDAHEKEASDFENKIQKEKEEKKKIENQISQLKTSYTELEDEKTQSENALKEQLKALQVQKDAEIEKLQNHISELLAEKDKLEVANNAYIWKIEQHASELNLCHLQLQQAKQEFNVCRQEQFVRNNLDPVKTKITGKEQIVVKKDEVAVKAENKSLPTLPVLTAQNPNQDAAADHNLKNQTGVPPIKDKPVEKPHVMPANNLGDGVLPKPLDLKPEEKDIDAALEITDDEKSKKFPEDNMLDNAIDRNAIRNNFLNDQKAGKLVKKDVNNFPLNGLENHPQPLSPVNFEHAEDKDDHAGERGDDGLQYANPDIKQQVEIPDYQKLNNQPKDVLPNPPLDNNDIAAQMRDMMDRSPGDVNNNAPEQGVLGLPPHHVGAIDNKINDLKNERPFLHRGGADPHRVIDDKNYEEDDDDRENDDEQPNGAGPAIKGNNVLQDNDFDDQDNPDNDNAKEEEGVAVVPK